MYQRTPKSSFKHAGKPLAPTDIAQAEKFWIMEARKSIYKDIEQGRYKRLCPQKNTDGIYVVGGRGERWIEMSHNKNKVLLLPYDHQFSRLYSEQSIEEDTLAFSPQPVKYAQGSGLSSY